MMAIKNKLWRMNRFKANATPQPVSCEQARGSTNGALQLEALAAPQCGGIQAAQDVDLSGNTLLRHDRRFDTA
ncbi:MAG: hypothetical protein ACKVPX_17480 [Myxococcaceae bacterium]